MPHRHDTRNQTAAVLPSPSDYVRPIPGTSRTTVPHCQALKRIFIGPFPISIAAPQLKHTHNVIQTLSSAFSESGDSADSGDSLDESLWRFVREYIRRSEDSQWDAELNPGLREELVNRLKKSPWLPNAGQREVAKWVGDTFEIGTDIFGANSVALGPSPQVASSHAFSSKGKAPSPHASAPPPPPAVNSSASYVTAVSSGSQIDQIVEGPVQPQSDNSSPRDYLSVPSLEARNSSDVDSQQAGSDVFLLPRSQGDLFQTRPLSPAATTCGVETAPRGEVDALRSALRQTTAVASERPRNRTLSVNFVDSDVSEGHQGPAHPAEVLARSDARGQLDHTSAGSAVEMRHTLSNEQATMTGMSVYNHTGYTPNDVQNTDRMLVQVSYTRTGGLSSQFDEEDARKHPQLEEQEWGEYVVTWKGCTLELYEDRSAFGRDWFLNNKRLAHVILLEKSRTQVSIFSHNDMSFCVISPPVEEARPSRRPRFHRSDLGVNVCVFKCKTRSRAIDWIWKLRLELGATIPPSIDVHIPVLGTRVTFNVPENYTILTVERIVRSCREVLSAVPEYRSIAAEVDRGAVALAWRRGMKLDWVWLESGSDRAARDWSVLFGLALQGRIPAQLELRLATHASTKAKLAGDTEVEEPEAIEGYLYRLKLDTQARTSVYLSSHDGNLFVTQPAHAFPPPIPQARVVPGDADFGSVSPFAFTREDERRRVSSQILNSSGYVDLRDVLVVRRTSLVTRAETRSNLPSRGSHTHDRVDVNSDLVSEDSDTEDPGGEAYLLSHKNSHRLKQKRTLEIVLQAGTAVRFEAHSVSNAIEWVRRLNVLVKYWTRRHLVDARLEMDLVHFASKQHSTMLRSKDVSRATPRVLPNPEAVASGMNLFWSWCVLDCCRPIVKAGQVYIKSEPRKQYKHMFMVLIAGHLVLFRIIRTPYALQRTSRAINLSAAFIYSGVLAAQHLPTLFHPQTLPRRYQDGLETDDSDLATTLVIRYRKQPLGWRENCGTEFPLTPLVSKRIPRTNSKYGLLILKARSQLERDAWCWALNAEMERTVRALEKSH